MFRRSAPPTSSTLLTALSATLLVMLGTSACSPSSGSAQEPLGNFTSDAAGFDTHSFYYDTGSEVVVFDAQFTEPLAAQLIAQIRGETSSPIRYVVITHPNPDKFNGVGPFRSIGAKVVASESTASAIPGVYAYKKYYFTQVAKTFTDTTYPPQATVDITFRGSYELPLLGDAHVTLRELQHAGVSTTQTVAHIPALDALIVGDLVHHQAHAWLEGGIRDGKPRPDLASWRLALAELAALPDVTAGTTVFGGRGQPARIDLAVTAQADYLTKMEALVTDYVTALGARKSELQDPTLAGMHYAKLADLATRRFPDYALPYMIEYGVYGLVNAIAGF